MDPEKRKRLEAAGYRIGDYGDFLGLTDAEREIVEFRFRLFTAIRDLRTRAGLSQAEFAARIGTSQPRAAKIEQGVGVSLDLMLKSYFALGGTLGDLTERKPMKRARRTPAAKQNSDRGGIARGEAHPKVKRLRKAKTK
jgi:transcriptional regulator with XRE-family HTH domain